MFIQLRLSQAAKEDKIPSLAQKSMIKHNDYLVNQGIGVNEEKTEVIKDKTAFSKENKSESILAKDDKSLVKDERKEDKSFPKDDRSLVKDDKSLVKDDKSFVKSQESKATSDKTPPLGRQQDKGRGGAVAKTGRIASMFEKASSPCPGGMKFLAQNHIPFTAPNFSGQSSNKAKTSKAAGSSSGGSTAKSDKGSEAKAKAPPPAVAKTQVITIFGHLQLTTYNLQLSWTGG